jgi:hypothetical protein
MRAGRLVQWVQWVRLVRLLRLGVSFAATCCAAWAVVVSTPSASAAADPADATPVDLLGTWFVLVHYKDSSTANPTAERWVDRVWNFAQKGSRLQWTDYPIVVFENKDGRFETLGRNSRSRTLKFWEPNPAQMAQIQEGPRINTRGVKTKTLRGSAARGYESFGEMRAMSASVIGYHETWTIASPSTLPVFTRDDVMGTGREAKVGGESENLEGRTRYTVTEVSADASELTGTFARDSSRRGTFRMIRSGSIQGLPTDDRTPNEKARDRAIDDAIRNEVGDDPEAQRKAREALEELERKNR